jgi:hypothetical protein
MTSRLSTLGISPAYALAIFLSGPLALVGISNAPAFLSILVGGGS